MSRSRTLWFTEMATNPTLTVQGLLKKLPHTALQVYSNQIFLRDLLHISSGPRSWDCWTKRHVGSLTFLCADKNAEVPREAAGAEPMPDTNCSPGCGKQPHADEWAQSPWGRGPCKKHDCGISLQENTQVWKLLDVISGVPRTPCTFS